MVGSTEPEVVELIKLVRCILWRTARLFASNTPASMRKSMGRASPSWFRIDTSTPPVMAMAINSPKMKGTDETILRIFSLLDPLEFFNLPFSSISIAMREGETLPPRKYFLMFKCTSCGGEGIGDSRGMGRIGEGG